MNNVSTIIHILVPQRSISIVFSSYFFIRRKSLHTKFAKETSNKASQNYIPSIRLGLDRLWPFFSVLSKYPTNFRSVVTQASLKRDVRDECLNQVLSSAESDPLPSAETCAVYLEKLCRAGNLADAAKLVQQLRAKQIFLSPNTYNLLLVTAGEWKDFGLLSQVFKDLLMSGKPISWDTYYSLAKTFSKATDTALLVKFEVDKAMLIFDHMKNLKCRPDLFTYNTVLAILGRAGRVDEMLHTVASMKEANMVPDIVSYNTLINNLRKVGRLDLCLVFFREMSERGIEPDLRTYTALIDSFGLSGNIEEALRLFADMKRKQVSPSVYVYGSLISNLKRVGKLDLAMSLSEEMNSCASNLVGPKDFKRKRR
ncbi:pentatricopeptide repeat-containing protein At1g11900-like isoform X2 [Macadamia integrifolia]|uniref:pentatricopeptide repeat-containing protein At1g11900-like isoform X2 n=1 Tax=Macadamia integrifolia TaxID=60698 RepID=UPI001C4F1963|nr:pentatricopeptide repeat-containing protein At1g11900-like isoform X2 [Macadamia integrifolia]